MYSSRINRYIDKLVKAGEEQSKFGRESLDDNKLTRDKPGYIKGEIKEFDTILSTARNQYTYCCCYFFEIAMRVCVVVYITARART
jgi:hypothetical protein